MRFLWVTVALLIVCAAMAYAMPADVREAYENQATEYASREIESAEPASLVEVDAASTINRASPLADVAELILEAKHRVGHLRAARNGVYMGSLTKLHSQRLSPAKTSETKNCAHGRPGHVQATLVPRVRPVKVVNPNRFGTHNPIESKNAVQAEVRDRSGRTILPYRDNVFPDPNNKAPADLDTPDNTKKLTAVERAKVDELQRRLHTLLDNLGANIVFDYAPVKNRRITSEFLNIRKETKALLDEYELRTGEKTIAWTLVEPDGKGLQEPHANIPDILNPHLPTIPIQRGLSGRPWKPTPLPVQKPAPEPLRRPREQRVSLRARTFKDGRVKMILATDTLLSKTKASPPGSSISIKVKSAMKGEEIIAAPFPSANDLAEKLAKK